MLTIPWFITRTIQGLFHQQQPPQPQPPSQPTPPPQREQQQQSQVTQSQPEQQQQPSQQTPLQAQLQRQPPPTSPQQQQQHKQQQQPPLGQNKQGDSSTGQTVTPRVAGGLPEPGVRAAGSSSSSGSSSSTLEPTQAETRSSFTPTAAEPPSQTAEPKLQTSTKILVLQPSVSDGRMSAQWAQQQIKKFEFDFDQADKDKSETLSFAEVYDVLKTVGFRGSEQEAKLIFGHLDRDNDQKITRVEFSAALKNLPRLSIKEFVLRKAFLKLDKDNSGYLTRSEIEDATKAEAGINIAASKIADLLIYLVKEDKDQKVGYEEFLYVFGVDEAATVMRQVFNTLDADGSGYLSREEILAAVKTESELKLKAEKISDLLIYWCKDADKKISYEEFLQVWLQQKEEKKK